MGIAAAAKYAMTQDGDGGDNREGQVDRADRARAMDEGRGEDVDGD